jgi:hypothetical protein
MLHLDETLLAVLEALPPQGLLTAELVCQRWREVATAHSQVLWKPLYERSPFSRWWLPYRPSDDFTSLKGTPSTCVATAFHPFSSLIVTFTLLVRRWDNTL